MARWQKVETGVIYLCIPVFLVLFTFFSIPFMLLSSIAIVTLIFCLHNSWRREEYKDFHWQTLVRYWPLLLLSLVVTYLCVVSPFKIWDWEKHYAVFNALVQNPWPPIVELNEQSYFLRYFPAWYILPSLLAKIFGSQLLTIFIFIWTTVGVFISLFLAFSYLQKIRQLLAAALVFFFFAGLDLVGAWLNGYVPPPFPHWPNIWISWGEIWPALTGLAWTPQHVFRRLDRSMPIHIQSSSCCRIQCSNNCDDLSVVNFSSYWTNPYCIVGID